MKTKKVILIFLLIISLMLPCVTACNPSANSDSDSNNKTPADNMSGNSDNNNAADLGDNNADSGEEVHIPTKSPLDLPEIKYDGYDFRVMNTQQSAMTWVNTTITSDEDTGVEVNDAVYIRNRIVEDRFDINIKEIVENSVSSVQSKARKSILAASDDFDLFMLPAAESMALAKVQLLTDYNEIPYVDLNKPYWDKDIKRDLSVGGRVYLIAGDFSMMHYGLTVAMFFNKKLITDLGLESPYNIIKEDKWTYDKFYEMASAAVSDLNGDGIMDENDRYGYLAITTIWSPAFLSSAGQQTVLKDENDLHYFGMDNEKFITVYQKMTSMLHTNNVMFDADDAGNHRLQDVMFPGNQALFWSECVHWATILRNMDSDFGIIVHPKFDESQNGYHNFAGAPVAMCVPATVTDSERTGMILETLCYESTDTVIKAYYDVLLKTKISRDDESEKMLDIIFQNRIYSISDVYYWGEIHGPMNSKTLSKQANADIAGWIDKNKDKIVKAIEKTNDALTK